MKTVICYESKDHNSVLKLVDAIAGKYSVELIDITKTRSADLKPYDLIGFASEIEEGAFYRDIASFAANWMPRDKKIFFLYTSPAEDPDCCSELEGTAHFKNCEVVGKYGCLGQDCASGFRLFGGKNKTHPNEEEIDAALKFYALISGEKSADKTEEKKSEDKKPEEKKIEDKKSEDKK